MKKFKKIMAILVAALMIAATMVPAWAGLEPETATNTITITVNTNKANSGTTDDTVDDPTSLPDKNPTTETYTAFKIFEVTKDVDTKGDTDNTTIDAQYKKVTSLVTPQYDANAKYYTQSTTTPHEYTEVSVTAEDFDNMKNTLYIESPSTTKGVAYFLRSTSPWYGVADADEEVLKYLKFTPTADNSGKVVEWIGSSTTAASEANARKLADALLALIHSNGSGGYYVGSSNSNTLTLMTESEGIYVGDYKTLSAGPNEVCVGYYLISSGLGSNLILATSDITVTEKNTYPTVDKQIIKTDDDAANLAAETRATDAQIGDTVKYQLTVVLPDEANQGFELHDVMGAGLTLKLNGDSTFVVKCNGTDVDQNDGASTPVAYWTIQYIAARASGSNSQIGVTANTVGVAGSNLTTGDAFVVKFTDAWVNHADRTADETYTIEYEAIVNKDAVLATDNSNKYNENKVNLKYSNYTTPYVSTKVYTHEFDLVKYYMNGGTATTLSGAKFEMYRDTQIEDGKLKNGAAKMTFVKTGNTYRVVDGVSVYPDNTETTTTLTSSDGTYDIEGLDVGDYYLLETYAPNGYNKLQYMTRVTVSAHKAAGVVDGTDVKQSTSASGISTVTYTMNDNAHTGDANVSGTTYTINTGVGVVNTAGTVLPSTGGMGTTVLYIVGGMLVILAGAYLFFSRKKAA